MLVVGLQQLTTVGKGSLPTAVGNVPGGIDHLNQVVEVALVAAFVAKDEPRLQFVECIPF